MKYDVFISYRRATGANDARLLEQALEARGFRVFFDYNSLRNGRFDEHIYTAIEQAEVFILIMSEGCLDRCSSEDDWVRMEIEYALKLGNKAIIPVAPSDQSWSFPSFLPQSLKELLLYQVSELNKAALFDASINEIIEDRFPEALKRKKAQDKNKYIPVGIPLQEHIESVRDKYAHFLYAEKGWSEFALMEFSATNDIMLGYKVSNSHEIPIRISWLTCSDIHDLINLDDDEFSNQAEEIYCKVPISPGQSVMDAWNSLATAFMPVLLFAYDVRGLIYESEKRTILIPMPDANPLAYKNRPDVCIRKYKNQDCVYVAFDESRLSQLISKTRVECSELVLNWINGIEFANS